MSIRHIPADQRMPVQRPTPSFGMQTPIPKSEFSPEKDPHVLAADNAHLKSQIDSMKMAIEQLQDQNRQSTKTYQTMFEDMQRRHKVELTNMGETIHVLTKVLSRRLEITPEEQQILAHINSKQMYTSHDATTEQF